jgi:hypothetical protein
MYMVRGTTGATPVLLVAHSARERKSWLQDLYSCIDDTVSKHYLRIGKPKRSSQPGIHISIPIGARPAHISIHSLALSIIHYPLLLLLLPFLYLFIIIIYHYPFISKSVVAWQRQPATNL